jgi:hypothetical protein
MIKLATIPKVTKSKQIRDYVAANPKAKPQAVADAIGVNVQYVYTVMWNEKRKTKLAKKAGGMQKKEAMTDKSNWSQLGLFSSVAPLVRPKTRMQSAEGDRMIEMFEPKVDPINHPAHYVVGGIETIDFIEAKKLGYNLGNVVKYLTRADHKGNKLEDLRKAQWHLTRETNAIK